MTENARSGLVGPLKGQKLPLTRVEVLGRYSNHADQGQRLRHLLDLASEGPRMPKTRTVRRVFRRLSEDQAAHLVEDYSSGASQRELACEFKVHPQSVAATLNRAGIARRDRGLSGDRLLRRRRRCADPACHSARLVLSSISTLKRFVGISSWQVRRSEIVRGGGTEQCRAARTCQACSPPQSHGPSAVCV